ncbi:MAG: ABC transporter permease, partial [Pseudomonadota bacterium]|nr:ABC transporter permease [Pseudomonadota bacterium]
MIPLLIYVAIFVVAFVLVSFMGRAAARGDYTSRKTVTFGDESAVSPNRIASVVSIATLFL